MATIYWSCRTVHHAPPAIMSGLMFLGLTFYNVVNAQILYAFRHIAINIWYLRRLGDKG